MAGSALAAQVVGRRRTRGGGRANAMVVGTVDRLERPIPKPCCVRAWTKWAFPSARTTTSPRRRLAATRYAWRRSVVSARQQVHVRGPVTRSSSEATADYWSKRPRGSQLAHGVAPVARSRRGTPCWTANRRDATVRRSRRGAGPPNWGESSDPPRSSTFGRAGKIGCTTGLGTGAASSGSQP